MIKDNDLRVGNHVRLKSAFGLINWCVTPIDFGTAVALEPIPIDKDWCVKIGMVITKERQHPSGNYDWIAEAQGLEVVGDKGEIKVLFYSGGGCTLMEHLIYVHQLQNFYHGYYGLEIQEDASNSEYYKG